MKERDLFGFASIGWLHVTLQSRGNFEVWDGMGESWFRDGKW